jgi:two-component system, NtrC family, response regulator GlrR
MTASTATTASRGKPLRVDESTLTIDTRGRALVRRAQLRVVDGEDAGAIVQTDGTRIVVGTATSADLVLRDPTVSRFQLEIELGETGVVLRDLGSRNGTWIGGVRVMNAMLGGDATIVVGRTTLRFELSADRVEVALHESDRFGSLVGRSIAMRRVLGLLSRAAKSEATLLLSGETGTGKDAAAESVHLESARRDAPFVALDCGAIPAGLLEAELFGWEKGAFTGAVNDRAGVFEQAHGGTLFLDEIGELPSPLQPKLLRVLERREVRRLGTEANRPVDVRVIAATNRDLREEVNHGRFRSDLFFRLGVLEVKLPPLRDRLEDLPILCEHLAGGDPRYVALANDASFLDTLRRRAWPGNVRELRNYLHRAAVLGEINEPIESRDPLSFSLSEPLRVVRDRWAGEGERRYLTALLAEHGDNVSAAARALGVSRVHLHRLLARAGLR